MKILFSPLGKRDPVNAGHDGSWLHCLRHYQPDLTVCYMSGEICTFSEKDNRYVRALEKLNKELSLNIQFRPVARPDLSEAHLFDRFYEDFPKILKDLHKEFQTAEIFLNISSGTPAMKLSLVTTYHHLPFKVDMIQVAGPHREMSSAKGDRASVGREYNLDAEWENNLDNLPDAENRCLLYRDAKQMTLLQIRQLENMIERHEYAAARLHLKSLGDVLPQKLDKALRGSVDRIQMDLDSAQKSLCEVAAPGAKNMAAFCNDLGYRGAEMALTMQIDLERKDLGSFCRKITPVLFALLCATLKNEGVQVKEIADNNLSCLSETKFRQNYSSLYNQISGQLFRPGQTTMLGSDQLMTLLKNTFKGDPDLKKALNALRSIERSVRNDVAHKPVKITEVIFREKTCSQKDKISYGTLETLQLIKKAYSLLDRELYNHEFWSSYQKMDEFMIALIRNA